MSVVKQVLLLVLVLAAMGINAAPGPEDCDGLNVTLPTNQLHTTYGDWVMVWSVCDNLQFSGALMYLASCKIELRLLPDNNTVALKQWTMLRDKSCAQYFFNMSRVSDSEDFTLNISVRTVEDNGDISQYNDYAKVTFLNTCPDCLMMVYRGYVGQFLLSYRREGHHQDVEQLKASHSDNKKLAECLRIPHANAFSYDGVSDFCPKTYPPPAVEHVQS
ncbi:Saxitoxin and tetrodotoxin-binding protein 1 [Collichthys lucidus]|uniref:Saxitoxin and tetrodotoxin-binding protein 1 n=1 Tax=Collichthys lucidus TaxID=240159 RepID=A0A4U5VSK4_COLLU|nr:Saxitoxin and tetrodotoxin-binding protein 1 [Collichthys lucidus]